MEKEKNLNGKFLKNMIFINNKEVSMNEYLKNRSYRTLVNADILSGIGDSLYNIVFIIYASTVPSKALAISLASFATVIPALLSTITGALSDRTKRKTDFMILMRLIQFGLFLILAMLISLQKSFLLFLILLSINIISDTIGSYSTSLTYPFLQHIVKPENLNSAMGLVSASDTTIQIIFQSLGAVLIVSMYYKYWLFGLINAVTFLIAAFILIKNRQRFYNVEKLIGINVKENSEEKFIQNLKKPMKLIKSNSFLLSIIMFAAMVNFFGSSLMALINLSLLQYKELWLKNYGNSVAVFNVAFSIGIIAGSLFMNDFLRKFKLFKLIIVFTIFLFLLGIAFLWHKSLLLSVIIACLIGYLAGKINPKISTIILMAIPDKYISATQGLLQMIALLAAPIGQFIFLTTANVVSVNMAWLLFTSGAVILIFISFSLSNKFNQLEIEKA